MSNKIRGFVGGAVAAVALLGVQQQAEAVTLQFRFTQGATTLTSATFAGSPTSINGLTVGDYVVNVTGSWLNGFAGGTQSNLEETTIQVRRTGSTSADALTVEVTAYDYTLPLGPNYIFGTTHAVTKTGTTQAVAIPVDFQGWVDFTNAAFGTQNTNGSISCTPVGGGSTQSCSVDGGDIAVAGSPLFSMTGKVTFNIGQNDQLSVLGTTSQAIIRKTPEPGTLALFGLGLLGLGFSARRKSAD